MVREAKIEKALVRMVNAKGGAVRKLAWVGRRGAPDRLVMVPGYFPFLVELKAPNGRLSALQEREHRILRDGGFEVKVIWSMQTLEELFA